MKSKGFTLIELLIVIAIIGILASVVLSSLNTARIKASDAAIKSNLTNIRTMASSWYDSNFSVYASAGNEFASTTCPSVLASGNIFSDQKVIDAVKESVAKSGGASRCAATASTWVVAVELKSTDGAGNAGRDTWCVDSVGSSRSYAYAGGETIVNAIGNSDACN